MIEKNINKNILLKTIALLFAIKKSEGMTFPSNDFLTVKESISKRQLGNNVINNGNNVIPVQVNSAEANKNKNNNNNNNNTNNINNNNNNNNNINGNNNNMNGGIQNLDCRYLSMVLDEFGLDYGWKQTNDCCNFNRITCVDATGQKTASTTNDSIITELYFNNMQLTGAIPISLCSITNLNILQFVNNEGLKGNIPPCIGGMNKLQKLVFSNTTVTGEIPKSISALSQLQYLSIENTSIQNNIPNEITNLKSLKKLYINNNKYINGPIPEDIDKLENLEMISFSDTHINGNIPKNIGSLSSLKAISFHHTDIEGTIPDSMGSLANLQTIKLHNTKLSGPLPESFKNLKNLKILTLNNTEIQGTLPSELTLLQYKECSFGESKICINDNDKKVEGIAQCFSSLPGCSSQSNGSSPPSKSGGMSFLTYTLMFICVVLVLGLIYYFYKRVKSKQVYIQEKRAINYYKNNITDQPKFMGSSLFHTPIVHNENIHAYNYEVQQNVDSSVFNKDSFINKFLDGVKNLKNHSYHKLNDSQYNNMNGNNMQTYLIHSDSVFQYNTMGMDDTIKQIKPMNEESFRNNDETFINNSEKFRLNNNPNTLGVEYEVMNKSISQKSQDSEKTEIETNPNKMYETMGTARMNYSDGVFKGTSSSSSSIPLPPNSENMVFMGKEAQEELKLFQQKNNLSFNDEETKSVKEQFEELEQMASNNYNTFRSKQNKSPKSLTKSPKSPYLNQFQGKSTPPLPTIEVVDYDKSSKSIDINDKIMELKNCSFRGLDLNEDNFHNSRTFDNIEKRFINNLNSLRTPENGDTKETKEENNENNETTEANTTKDKVNQFFANIPGLQIQEYYNQLNFSMAESNNSVSGWNNNSKTTGDNGEKKFEKIIPSGIFTTNKTSWDDEDSFFSNESSFRNTKSKSKDFNSINTSSLNNEIKNKLGTESIMKENDKYNSGLTTDDSYSKYSSSVTEDSRYRSGVTEDSRYRSGVTTDDGYSKYASGVTEDSRYRSGVTDDDYSKYRSGVTEDSRYRSGVTEDSRYRSGVTDDDYSKYKSGLTTDDGYSKYTSGVTEDSRYRSGVTDDDYSKYKSGLTTDDGYSKYTSGVTEDSRYRSGVTDDDYSKYKSGLTTDDGYSKYKSGLTTDDGYSKYTSGITTDDGYSKYTSGVTTDDGYSKYTSGFTNDRATVDLNRNSTINSMYTNVFVTEAEPKKLSTDSKGTDSTRYTSSTTNTYSKDSKDFSTGYSSTGYTLSNANTLSSGFTLNSSIKTNSNGSSLAPPKTNSSRTTKSSLNQVSTITSILSTQKTDSLFSDFSKLSSLDSVGTISSLSFTDSEDESKL